jgi:hypothetical protein
VPQLGTPGIRARGWVPVRRQTGVVREQRPGADAEGASAGGQAANEVGPFPSSRKLTRRFSPPAP